MSGQKPQVTEILNGANIREKGARMDFQPLVDVLMSEYSTGYPFLRCYGFAIVPTTLPGAERCFS